MELNARDIARILNVSENTVYRLIKQKQLPAYPVNHQYRFNHTEVLEWATAQGIAVQPYLQQEGMPHSAVQPTTLEQAIRIGGIRYKVKGKTVEDVLRYLISTMDLPQGVDRDMLLKVLLTREELGSTGIGDGIAIPHVRNPLILHLDQPSITLCFLETPINFNAIDNKPVHTLFTLITPTVRAHLQILSLLSYALRDEQLKEKLQNRAPEPQILQQIQRIEQTLYRNPTRAD
jgi:PTS system nitrogen regulatory IIA component